MNKTKKLTVTALLCTISYILTVFIHMPLSSVDFLTYDPKDAIIVVAGFMFGPLSAFLMSVAVSLLELVTISNTGIIGCIMNIVSTVAFACVSSLVYKSKRTVGGAVTGLILGMIATTGAMLIWNYFLTPVYMGIPQEAIAKMLVPVFLPFNLIKSGLNTALALFIYKPFVTALRRSGFIESEGSKKFVMNSGVYIVSIIIAAVSIGLYFILR